MRSLLLIGCCLIPGVSSTFADDSAAEPLLRTLVVPQDHPEEWPAGDWRAVAADDYAEFVEWLNQSGSALESACALGVAEYTGGFDGDQLLSGELTLELQSPWEQPQLIPMGTFSLRLQNLQWEDGTTAVWGVAADQNSHLWVEANRQRLTAEWMQRGRRIAGADAADVDSGMTYFHIQLPPAVASRLRLRVPSAQTVRCTSGVMSGVEPIPGAELNEWTIECGPRNQVTLMIMDASESAQQPAWVADLAAVATARTDGLHFEADLTIESSVRLPSELGLRIPRDLNVNSVRTSSDAPVTFRVTGSGSRRTLRIILPHPEVQRSVVRIRGMMPLSTQRTIVYPFVAIPEASGITSTWTLQVDRPLELKSISPQGLRQTKLTVAAQRETWSFLPQNAEPRLAFQVGYPETTLTGQTWNFVDLASPLPELRAINRLDCARGTVYGSEWTLPREWSVVSVRSPERQIATWTTHADPEAHSQTLRVEYRDPLDAGEVAVVEVVARSAPWHLGEIHPLPVVHHQGDSLKSILSVRQRDGLQWTHNASTTLTSITASAADAGFPASAVEWEESSGHTESWEVLNEDAAATCRLVDSVSLEAENAQFEFGSTLESVVPAADDARQLQARLRVQTHIAGSNWSHHTHRCRFILQPHDDFDLLFTLERRAELLHVFVDGQRIEPLLSDEGFRVPVPSTTQEVQVDYLTPAGIGVVIDEEFPLPQANLTSTLVDWEFLLPPERAIAGEGAGTNSTHNAGHLSLTQRLLGPLARGPSESVFGFQSPDDAASSDGTDAISESAFDDSGVHNAEPSHRTLLLVTRGGLLGTRLTLWDVRTVRSASWSCLLGAFLVLLALRRAAPKTWKYSCVAVMAVSFAVAWFASPPLAVTSGGVLMGALLAIAVPRNLVHPSPESPSKADPPPQRPSSVVVTGSTGLLLAILVVQGAFGDAQSLITVPKDSPKQTRSAGQTEIASDGAPSPPAATQANYDVLLPTSPGAAGDAADTVWLGPRLQTLFETWQRSWRSPPACLLNSARYQVSFEDGSLPVVTTELQAFLDPAGSGSILLPFRDVVVVGSAEAEVNGLPATLIPAADGAGFGLSLSDGLLTPTPADDGSEGNSPPFQVAAIRLKFRVRGDQQSEVPTTWTAGIPRISQSDVVLVSSDAALYSLVERVDQYEEGESTVIRLQPDSTLKLVTTGSAQQTAPPEMNIRSSVELGPGVSAVHATIDLEAPVDSSEALVVPIELPVEAIVRGVQPPGNVDVLVERRPTATILWLELKQRSSSREAVEIDYLLGTTVTPTSELRLPALSYWHRPQVGRHQLELTPRAGFQWGTRPGSTVAYSIVNPEPVADAEAVLNAPRAAVTVEMNQPSETFWDIQPVLPARQVNLSERVELRPGDSRWVATLEIDSVSAPSFQFAFQVDPSVTIETVSVECDGAERLLRWRQDRDRLIVFVTGDPTGLHNVEISGQFATPRSTPFRLPRFEPSDANITAHKLTVVNQGESAVLVEASIDGGNRIEPQAELTFTAAANQQLAAPANLQFAANERAVAVTESIWMMPTDDGAWTIWQRWHFEDPDGPLAEQILRAPPEWEHISVNASTGNVREGSDANGRLLRLDAGGASSVELNLVTRVSIRDSSAPVATLSSNAASTTLLLPGSIAVRTAEWVEMPVAPDVIRSAPEGFSQIRDWVGYQPITPGIPLPSLPDAIQASQLQVVHAESDMFCSSHSIIGETRFDILPGGQTSLLIQRPPETTILDVTVDGRTLLWDSQSDIIPVPDDRPATSVSLSWTADPFPKGSRRSLADLIPLPMADDALAHDICCFHQGAGSYWLPERSRSINTAELWLHRWQDLCRVAEHLGGQTVEDPRLMSRIQRCEEALSRHQLAGAFRSGSELSQQYQEWRNRWMVLQQSWPDTVDLNDYSETASALTLGTSWDAELWTGEQLQIFQTTLPYVGGDPASVEIRLGTQVWQRHALGVGCAVLIVLAGVWGLRRTTRLAWDDRFARHPQIAWLLLGIFWWLFLSPSLLGAFVVALVLALLVVRAVRHLTGGRRDATGTSAPASSASQ